MKKVLSIGFLLISLSSCFYGVNEKTSIIGSLNTDCVESGTWERLHKNYSISKVVDNKFLEALNTINDMPFKTEVYYFEESPSELIGVSEDHYSVRYVFNPEISTQVLDGLSSELSKDEKKRIRDRIQRVIMNFQCQEGKEKSQITIDTWK